MIKGVNSVIIWTEDVKKLANFYRDTLGLKTADMGDEFALFEMGGAQLALGAHSEVKGKSKEPNRVMVNLDVDDAQAEFQRLKAKGVQFVREPSPEPAADGTIIATLQDPDGNTLQLFQSA